MADLSRTPVTLIGASRGLGRVLAETFHRLGAQVLIVARGQSSLDAGARDLPGMAGPAGDPPAAAAPAPLFAGPAPRLPIPRGRARRAGPAVPVAGPGAPHAADGHRRGGGQGLCRL